MKHIDSATLEQLWYDFDAREVTLAAGGGGPARREPAAAASPDHVVATYFFAFRTMTLDEGRRRDQLPRHQRRQAPAARLAAGAVLGAAGGGRCVRRDRPDRPAARGLPAEDDAPARRPPDLVRPAAHRRRRDHLRRLREPGRAAGRPADPRRGAAHLPGPGHGPARGPARGPASPPTSRPSARSSSRRRGSPPTTSAGSSRRSPGSPLLMFIKEDEDLYPNLDYSPVAERTRRRLEAIERVRDRRGGLGLIFAPHVSGRPARDRRDGPRGGRGGGLGRHVQRDLRRGDRPDGPRGDQAPRPTPRRSTATTPASASRRGRSGARSSTCSPGSTASTSARPAPVSPGRRSSGPTAPSGRRRRTP